MFLIDCEDKLQNVALLPITLLLISNIEIQQTSFQPTKHPSSYRITGNDHLQQMVQIILRKFGKIGRIQLLGEQPLRNRPIEGGQFRVVRQRFFRFWQNVVLQLLEEGVRGGTFKILEAGTVLFSEKKL